MYYSELVRKASVISLEAHKNDLDKGGYPYFMHPVTLALQFDDEDSVCVALLHDVVEDHGDRFFFNYLRDEGFGDSVIDALKLLTHDPKVPYLDYIETIKENKIATRVKLADLKNNSDLSRMNGIKPPKYELYLKAIEMLEESE